MLKRSRFSIVSGICQVLSVSSILSPICLIHAQLSQHFFQNRRLCVFGFVHDGFGSPVHIVILVLKISKKEKSNAVK
jgi:hypothetical protein